MNMKYIIPATQSNELCDCGMIQPIRHRPKNKEKQQNEIAEHVKSYIESGGQIKTLPILKRGMITEKIKLSHQQRRILRKIGYHKTCKYSTFEPQDEDDIRVLLKLRLVARGNYFYWLTGIGREKYYNEKYIVNTELEL